MKNDIYLFVYSINSLTQNVIYQGKQGVKQSPYQLRTLSKNE